MRWPSLLRMMVLYSIKRTYASASLFFFVKLTQIARGLTHCCFRAVDLVACTSKTEQSWGHTVDVPCDSSRTLIQIRKFQSSWPKSNLMFCVKIRAAVCLLKQFQAWQKVDHCTPEPTAFACISSSYQACFSELYLPDAESGHRGPERKEESFRSKQQRCGDDRVADMKNDLSPPNRPQLLFSPGKIRESL